MFKNRYDKKEGYIFSKKDGSIYSRQSINLPQICRNIGIEPRSFHALRHTHATILLSAGVHPKVVQERLGHAKISTTLDTYSHLVPGMQQAAINVFDKIT
jgi:integrase